MGCRANGLLLLFRLHNEELHRLYFSPNIVRMNKSRRLRWAGHLAIMEESRSTFKILTVKPPSLLCVHIHVLFLIKKDICDRQNISIKLLCVCVCLTPGDLFILPVGFLFLFLFLMFLEWLWDFIV